MAIGAWWLGPFSEFAFMRRALAACFALSLSSAPVGVLLTLRRMSLVGDATPMRCFRERHWVSYWRGPQCWR